MVVFSVKNPVPLFSRNRSPMPDSEITMSTAHSRVGGVWTRDGDGDGEGGGRREIIVNTEERGTKQRGAHKERNTMGRPQGARASGLTIRVPVGIDERGARHDVGRQEVRHTTNSGLFTTDEPKPEGDMDPYTRKKREEEGGGEEVPLPARCGRREMHPSTCYTNAQQRLTSSTNTTPLLMTRMLPK